MTNEEFKEMERVELIAELVREAHAEDDREGGAHFKEDGWWNYFLEDFEARPRGRGSRMEDLRVRGLHQAAGDILTPRA